MKPKQFQLAQANIARMRAPLEDPSMEGFRGQLDRITMQSSATGPPDDPGRRDTLGT